jgi:hypothetical protein
MNKHHRVVVIGGGFAGLQAVHSLRHATVHVTLIDRRNFHLFQPLLYQVATGGLSPANIASPLRSILRRQHNARVLLGEVVGIDIAGHRVQLRDGGEVPYDTLIVATGSSHQYFGHDDWEKLAPGLKTIEDATTIRRSILYAFEQAERESDATRVHTWMTFVVIGGGPTGVELAGAPSEIANDTLRSPPDTGAARGQDLAAVPLPGSGHDGHDRPLSGRGQPEMGQILRVFCLAGLALRASHESGGVRKPAAGIAAMGMELLHAQPFRAADHREGSRGRAGAEDRPISITMKIATLGQNPVPGASSK